MSSYDIAFWAVFGILMIILINHFIKVNSNRAWCISTSIMVVLTISLVGIGIAGETNRDNIKNQELCNTYCDCLETKSCPYTFDYKDVVNCDCEVNR